MRIASVIRILSRTIAVAIFFLATGANMCWACRATPQAQLMSPDEQISGASNITIAKAVSEEAIPGGSTVYKFVVQRQLLGPDPAEFTLIGGQTPLLDTSYDSHADPAFWKRGGGRSFANTACLISPGFQVGKSYIVFLDSTLTKRSFEQLDAPGGMVNENDEWLLYIKKKLAEQGR